MSRTNPPAGTCPGQGAAIACSGFNSTPPHDASSIDISSGDAQIQFGYQNCAGCPLFAAITGPGFTGHFEASFAVLSYVYPAMHSSYNRVYCAHYTNQNTYAYMKCDFETD